MNISFELTDKVNGLLTLTVEENDYKDNVEKTLKDYRKRANIPGFRPGQAPMGLVKRQVGASVKMDEINKFVGEQLYKYIQDNKIQMLGEPLPSAKQEAQDLEKDAPYTFVFDIAIAPEFKVELTAKDKVKYYDIIVDNKLVDEQVDMFASRSGQYKQVENFEGNDMLKGDLRELDANGNTKEGGLTVEAAVLMPAYLKDDEQKKLFEGAKLGDIITFNPKKAYPGSDVEVSSLLKIKKEEAAEITADFSYQITEITRYEKAEVNQVLFDSIYGEGVVKDEKDFREKISEGIKEQLKTNSDYRFILDVRTYCEEKVGTLAYPEELLKRIMLNNNKDKGQEYVDKNFEASLKELTWHLIKEQLIAQTEIKVNDDDVREAAKEQARIQFAQYGMTNVPEEYLTNYAEEMLKNREAAQGFVDRAIDRQLTNALKGVVKLDTKEISLEDFNKLMSE